MNELSTQVFEQPFTRGVQLLRDGARLVLKVPIRALWTPIILEKNWKELERAKINAKLTGYAFVQLACVPAKFVVALVALITSPISSSQTASLLNMSKHWTAHLDGRASQLEALKEVGRKYAANPDEYNKYRDWLYQINPELCCKQKID